MIIGRNNERACLTDAYNSEYSEFIAIYGRRRVGKTFLVRETFQNKLSFSYSGLAKATTRMQLHNFHSVLKQHGYKKDRIPNNWIDAFYDLSCYLDTLPEGKKVVFLDELPWMDAPKSSFLLAFENFWNGWASARKDILLIICGSVTSWIVKKVFHNKGGLHNRLSDRIYLKPFTLKECEEYADSRNLKMTRKLITEAYMILGGVPYYWSMLKRGMSLSDNVNNLFFVRDAKLQNEYNELYSSLFKKPEPYMSIISALGKKKVGMSREEVVKYAKIPENGRIKEFLDDLESCGFIRRYNAIGAKVKNAKYQLIDNFTLFHFKFLADRNCCDEAFWSKIQNSPIYYNWSGHAFERICLLHSNLIKKALGIEGVMTSEYSWRQTGKDITSRAEIDLLIDRNDHAINVIEVKYSKGLYEIDKKYMSVLNNKVARLRDSTKTTKSIFLTMITSEGLTDNAYSKEIDHKFDLNIFFE